MVKIYLQDIDLTKIKNKVEDLKKYLTKEEEEIHLFSKEYGHYKIAKEIVLLEPSYHESYQELDYQGHSLLIDKNIEEKIHVVSQLPVEYIYNKRICREYKRPLITLIIYGVYENVKKEEQPFLKKSIQDYKGISEIVFCPIDFYFECDNKNFNLENLFFQQEFNMFLSMLN